MSIFVLEEVYRSFRICAQSNRNYITIKQVQTKKSTVFHFSKHGATTNKYSNNFNLGNDYCCCREIFLTVRCITCVNERQQKIDYILFISLEKNYQLSI